MAIPQRLWWFFNQNESSNVNRRRSAYNSDLNLQGNPKIC